jgi:hypothetical protein
LIFIYNKKCKYFYLSNSFAIAMAVKFSIFHTETLTQVNNQINLRCDTDLYSSCQEELLQETDDSDWYETYDEQEDIVEKALCRKKDLGQKAANKKARHKASRLDAKHKRQEDSQRKQEENVVLPCHNVHDLMEIYKINMQEIAQHAIEAQSFAFDQKQRAERMAEVLASIKPACPQTSEEIDF